MKRPLLIAVLVLGGCAVLLQNVVYFTGSEDAESGALDEETYAPASEPESGAEEPGSRPPLESLSDEELVRYLERLSPRFRSPFLTLAEWQRPPEDLDLMEAGEGLSPVVAARRDPSLAGTLWSRGRRVAWIDGSPWSEGDEVRGFTVVRIEPDAVVLRGADRQLHLKVGVSPEQEFAGEERGGEDDGG